MRKFILAGVTALGIGAALPAQATVMVNGDGSVTFDNGAGINSVLINFNGLGGDPKVVVPGLSGQLTLTLNSIAGNTFNFGYSMLNNSTLTGARISGIGFDVDPNVTGVGSTGVFEFASLGGFAAGFNSEVCFNGGPNANNCPNTPENEAIGLGQTGVGTLALTFGSPLTSITLSNFLDRYQGFSTSVPGQTPPVGSAVGQGTPVRGGGVPPPGAIPEPATWATMILGFGLIGGAMRRRALRNARLAIA